MTNESLWLIRLLKDLGYKNLFVKSFYITKTNHKIWDDSDIKSCDEVISRGYVGVSNWKDNADYYFTLDDPHTNNTLHSLSWSDRVILEIDFKFNCAGQLAIPLDNLKKNEYDDFCRSLFIQLMMASSKGYNVALGYFGKTFIKAHNENESLISCDMMVE